MCQLISCSVLPLSSLLFTGSSSLWPSSPLFQFVSWWFSQRLNDNCLLLCRGRDFPLPSSFLLPLTALVSLSLACFPHFSGVSLHPFVFRAFFCFCLYAGFWFSLCLDSFSWWKSRVFSSPPEQMKMKVWSVCWRRYRGNVSPVCSPSTPNEQLLTRKHLFKTSTSARIKHTRTEPRHKHKQNYN